MKPTYWLTRFILLRLLALVYAIAFLVAINQAIPLLGSHGLSPMGHFLSQAKTSFGNAQDGFIRLPTLFWFSHSDTAILIVSWTGFLISCLVLAGFGNAIIMTVLWFLYMSLVNAGQEWYGYGWEIQLLETGFLAIFLCPLIDARPFPKRPPPFFIIVLFRWLIFRIMIGAGMIKWRGDDVWRNATALYYHFETQPIPGPFSRWFHFLPRGLLKLGVWYNFLAELIAPWFIFWPRLARHIAGLVIVLLQLILIASGNLSFLNWLTLVPAIACFDDGFWSAILPRKLVRYAQQAIANSDTSTGMERTSWVITVIVVLLSIQPALNIISPNQVMNTSYDPLNLVNTYGAFGSVGRERMNVVFEGTLNDNPDDSTGWKEYPYKGLPVFPDERPAQIAPYQLRFDWQMWFAAMGTPDDYPWTYTLVAKLLHNDPLATGLFRSNPFADQPPKYVRAVLYRYRFAPPGNPQHLWWTRDLVNKIWMPALSLESFRH